MSKKSSVAYAVIFYFSVAVTVTGIVLKLCGILTLSWWWITAPVWGLLLLVLLALGFICLCAIFLSKQAKTRR